MSAALAPVRPGPLHGARPERFDPAPPSRLEGVLQARLEARLTRPRPFRRFAATLTRIHGAAERLRAVDELDRHRRRRALAMHRRGAAPTSGIAVAAFAHVLVECESLFGVTLHDEQLYAGWAMWRGALVEMRTGEGKTLAATLPAVTAALGGTPVHVLTANDYLAARDRDALAPLYERFGLSVARVGPDLSHAERTEAYGADVVYGSARTVAFDHLRDARTSPAGNGLRARLAPLLDASSPPRPLQRGLCFAIVDEADDVLIDAARTPLVLSESRAVDPGTRARAAVALTVARTLHADVDFRLDASGRGVLLSDGGRATIDAQTGRLDGVWRLPRYRHELLRQALAALHVRRADHDYLVRDGRVVLIDAASGRPQPDHRLRDGLHELLEVKEGCRCGEGNEVVAATSFQRFFARYHHLCGTSGTLHEVRRELATVYRSPVVRVPTHRPCRLVRLPRTVLPGETAHADALVRRVRTLRAAGRPVLLVTRTLQAAERIGERLRAANIAHARLDARHDAHEARVLADAGRAGAVTLATPMAGRGCDVPLDARATEAGGLHVMELEASDSGRVGRQLHGRAARQGEPGSCESLLHLDDEALSGTIPAPFVEALRRLLVARPVAGGVVAAALFAIARRRTERRHARARTAVFHRKEQELRQLALAGDQGS